MNKLQLIICIYTTSHKFATEFMFLIILNSFNT